MIKVRTRKYLTSIIVGLAFLQVGLAQELDSIAHTIQLEGVMVNALSLPVEPKSYPGMVGMIDSMDLVISSPLLINETLNQTPGVLMQSGALNTNRITIRGIGSRTPFGTNKIRAFFGEIPLTDGGGETSIEDIDLSLVRQFEVLKGPNSSLYGAGLGGAIILHPNAGNQSRASMNATVGSFGTLKYGTAANVELDKHQLSMSYQNLHSDGYRDNNVLDRSSVFSSWGFNSDNDELTLLLLFVRQKAFIPSSIGESAYQSDPSAAAFTWASAEGFEAYDRVLTGISWTHHFDDRISATNTLFTSIKDNYEPRPFNILEDRTLGYGVRSRLTITEDNWSYNVGGEFYRDQFDWRTFENLYRSFPGEGSVQGDLLTANYETRSFVNVFVQGSYQVLTKTRVDGGLNMNYTGYDFTTDGGSQTIKNFKPIWSPRLSLVQEIGSRTNIFATVSHGFSPPSIEETLNSEGQFNQEIQPETGWNREIGIKGDFTKFSYAASFYTMKVKNLLVTRRTAEDVTFGKNSGRTQHNGFELEGRALIMDLERTTVTGSLSYNLALYEFTKFKESGNDFSGNSLTGVPGNQLNLNLNQAGQIFFSGVNFQFIDEMPITDGNEVFSESYSLLSVHVGLTHTFLSKWNCRLVYRLQNALNQKYASMVSVNAMGFRGAEPRYYYPGLPRNQQVNLSVSYLF
jgi:iron complex outermembrane receptor protein